MRPSFLSVIRLTAALLAAVLAIVTPSAARADAAPAATAAPTKPLGPIEQLVSENKLDQAILDVDKLRAASAGKRLADAESEFWAARAEVRLKLRDAARQRFMALAQAYPTHPRAGAALIEATTSRLALLEGKAKTDGDRKLAADSAKELEAVSLKYTADDEVFARSLYIAGNAWRQAADEAAAVRAYERGSTRTGSEYGAKNTLMLATLAARDFDVARAKTHYNACMTKWPDTETSGKCAKAATRAQLIGSPAPSIEAETWLAGTPVDTPALKGKVVLVWFFATWCPHCKETMPEMASRLVKFKDKPFQLIGMTHNSKGQTTESARAFAKDPKWGLTYPTAVDDAGKTTIAFNAGGVPAAVLIDKTGRIRWADHPTYLTDAMIERLLAE